MVDGAEDVEDDFECEWGRAEADDAERCLLFFVVAAFSTMASEAFTALAIASAEVCGRGTEDCC